MMWGYPPGTTVSTRDRVDPPAIVFFERIDGVPDPSKVIMTACIHPYNNPCWFCTRNVRNTVTQIRDGFRARVLCGLWNYDPYVNLTTNSRDHLR